MVGVPPPTAPSPVPLTLVTPGPQWAIISEDEAPPCDVPAPPPPSKRAPRPRATPPEAATHPPAYLPTLARAHELMAARHGAWYTPAMRGQTGKLVQGWFKVAALASSITPDALTAVWDALQLDPGFATRPLTMAAVTTAWSLFFQQGAAAFRVAQEAKRLRILRASRPDATPPANQRTARGPVREYEF